MSAWLVVGPPSPPTRTDRFTSGTPAAPGHIRAYDIRAGKVIWTFHTIPYPGEEGADTWPPDAWTYVGGANCWAGMAVDERRGLLFVPTGSAAFDFWGGNRIGQNLFANCLLALDANTGRRRWHFQFVHHDLWDRDLPSPPSTQGTIVFPGFDGGGEWGGAAVDLDGVLYVNANEMPWILTMVQTRLSAVGRAERRTRRPVVGNPDAA